MCFLHLASTSRHIPQICRASTWLPRYAASSLSVRAWTGLASSVDKMRSKSVVPCLPQRERTKSFGARFRRAGSQLTTHRPTCGIRVNVVDRFNCDDNGTPLGAGATKGVGTSHCYRLLRGVWRGGGGGQERLRCHFLSLSCFFIHEFFVVIHLRVID